jgi:hypothetical protein
MAHGPPAPERLDAHVAGQHVSFSTYNLVNVLFIALLGILVYLFWDSGKVIMQRDMQDRHRIAQEQLQVLEALRLQADHHHAAMFDLLRQYDARLVEQTHLLAKWFLIMSHNMGLPPAERIPFGAHPPWLEEQLREQAIPRKD